MKRLLFAALALVVTGCGARTAPSLLDAGASIDASTIDAGSVDASTVERVGEMNGG